VLVRSLLGFASTVLNLFPYLLQNNCLLKSNNVENMMFWQDMSLKIKDLNSRFSMQNFHTLDTDVFSNSPHEFDLAF